MKTICITLAIILSAGAVSAQPKAFYTPEDVKIFHEYISYIAPWQTQPTGKLLEKTAAFFLDKPYAAHTLEINDEEVLVANLRLFDCTTYVETVIALTRAVRSGYPAFDTFLNELQRIRYREGKVEGYPSRLHYATDWLYHNETKGILKNISAELGGVRLEKTINFMTSNRESYRQLKSNDTMLTEMAAIEKDISDRGGFNYLPKANIAITAPLIPHMSVIAFTTSINGLDVTHMGFAYQEEERLTFIHASSAQKKVVIDTKTLSDYCASQAVCTGIIIANVE